MKAKEVMTPSPACCTPDTNLQTAARQMCDFDCGELPVVDAVHTMKLVGVLTDRDLVCRAVSEGRNPLQMKVQDVMTKGAISVSPEDELAECFKVMEGYRIRRVPVCQKGAVVGIIALADLARHASPDTIGRVLKSISSPASSKEQAAA